jgi:hypothetical protein
MRFEPGEAPMHQTGMSSHGGRRPASSRCVACKGAPIRHKTSPPHRMLSPSPSRPQEFWGCPEAPELSFFPNLAPLPVASETISRIYHSKMVAIAAIRFLATKRKRQAMPRKQGVHLRQRGVNDLTRADSFCQIQPSNSGDSGLLL